MTVYWSLLCFKFSGKVKPFLKSQPIPKRQDSPVRVIVAKNFEQEVMQTKKDVLIEFYAPWCGHCKNLEPIYKKLAKQLSKTNPDVVIAKMDATANDVPPLFKVSGFPTIYFLKANEKDNPITFSGDRSLKKLKVSDQVFILLECLQSSLYSLTYEVPNYLAI